MSAEPALVWTVIKLVRDVGLPRFNLFAGETWRTYREVGERFPLGAGTLDRDLDFVVLYQGDRKTARTFEAPKLLRRCQYHSCRGCETCGGQFA
jgi:hypothetical protein